MATCFVNGQPTYWLEIDGPLNKVILHRTDAAEPGSDPGRRVMRPTGYWKLIAGFEEAHTEAKLSNTVPTSCEVCRPTVVTPTVLAIK